MYYSSYGDAGPLLPSVYIFEATNEGTFQYTNHYGDISFNFYNQLGQLTATIAPEGVKKLIDNINAFSSLSDVPFVTTFEYDSQGRLIATTSPDAGRAEFIYRVDGNIRFSQNAEQRKAGRFSYTNYDRLARPVESGEYIPGNINFESLKRNYNLQESTAADGGLSGGTKQQWTKTLYDFTDNSHGVSGYVQDEFFLKGGISLTENEQGKTWYNYDSEGRVAWLIKQISGFGIKTIDYSYNGKGSVSRIDYQKSSSSERFVHEYEYDADGRLLAAYTTNDPTVNRKLQAKYYYYLHGPLKRVELAQNLQGVDYTYTPQGWLKTINHPEQSKDPGKDGLGNGFAPDVFGMTLEYFNGDYVRTGTGINSLSTGSSNVSYNGNIMAQSWKTSKPASVVSAYGSSVNNPAMFTYEYDAKSQFSSNKYGNPNFANNTFTEAANQNRESGLSYDRHGNIQSLTRTNRSGSVINFLSYHYQTNTNRLTSVDNYATYHYNDMGQMTAQVKGDQAMYLEYTVGGQVKTIYSDTNLLPQNIILDQNDILNTGQQKVVRAGNSITLSPGFEVKQGATFHALIQAGGRVPRVSFAYDENGNRVSKTDHLQNITTYYVNDPAGNVLEIYDNDGTSLQQKEVLVYAAGRIGMYRKTSGTYQYELTDHLGNVRAVIGQNKTGGGLADVVYYSDYYPYGSPLTLGGNDYRYGYQGQYAETDKESAWVNFALRMYDPVIGRWMTTDPYGQYHSPYVGMGNDPVNGVDPDGGLFEKQRAWLWSVFNGGGGRTEKGANGWVGYGKIDQGVSGRYFKYSDFYVSGQIRLDYGFQFGLGAKVLGVPVSLYGAYETKPLVDFNFEWSYNPKSQKWSYSSNFYDKMSGGYYDSSFTNNEYDIGLGIIGFNQKNDLGKRGEVFGVGPIKSKGISIPLYGSKTAEFSQSAHGIKHSQTKRSWGVGEKIGLLIGLQTNFETGFKY